MAASGRLAARISIMLRAAGIGAFQLFPARTPEGSIENAPVLSAAHDEQRAERLRLGKESIGTAVPHFSAIWRRRDKLATNGCYISRPNFFSSSR